MNTDEYREYCTWIDTYFSIKRVENTERVVLNLIDTDEYNQRAIVTIYEQVTSVFKKSRKLIKNFVNYGVSAFCFMP